LTVSACSDDDAITSFIGLVFLLKVIEKMIWDLALQF